MRNFVFFILLILSFPIAAKAEPPYKGTVTAFEKIQGGWGDRKKVGEDGWSGETFYAYEHLWQTLYIDVEFPESEWATYTYTMELDLVDFIVKTGDEIIITEEFIGDLPEDSFFRGQIGGQERLFDMRRSKHKVRPTSFWAQPT
jgi:hypothetical protein